MRTNAEFLGQSDRYQGERLAGDESSSPFDVDGKIAVAQSEPRRTTESFEFTGIAASIGRRAWQRTTLYRRVGFQPSSHATPDSYGVLQA